MKPFCALLLAVSLVFVSGSPAAQILQNLEDTIVGKPSQEQVAAARAEVGDAAQAALSALYAIQPGARRDVERAAGYAAFSTFGMKLLVAGGTSGKGLAVNQRNGARTFMKMVQVQGGLGFGVSKNQVVFVFTTPKGLGIRGPGQCLGDGRGAGRHVHWRGRPVAGRVRLPDHGDGTQRRADRRGDAILRRPGPQLMPPHENRIPDLRSNLPMVPFQFAQGENEKWECTTEFLVSRWSRRLP